MDETATMVGSGDEGLELHMPSFRTCNGGETGNDELPYKFSVHEYLKEETHKRPEKSS